MKTISDSKFYAILVSIKIIFFGIVFALFAVFPAKAEQESPKMPTSEVEKALIIVKYMKEKDRQETKELNAILGYVVGVYTGAYYYFKSAPTSTIKMIIDGKEVVGKAIKFSQFAKGGLVGVAVGVTAAVIVYVATEKYYYILDENNKVIGKIQA
jgi:hypothetical protein